MPAPRGLSTDSRGRAACNVWRFVEADDQFNENVATIASLRMRAQRNLSRHQKWIERFTAEVARPHSLYAIAVLACSWIAVNVASHRLGRVPLDPPPFAWLQGAISLVALLVTTMVLVTQSRQSRDFEQRAELELQINLLAEQKIAKLIALVEELRRDLPTVSNRVDPLAEVMQEPVDPHAVLSALEHALQPPPQRVQPQVARLDEGEAPAERPPPR